MLLLSPPNPLRWALAGAPFCTVSTDSIVLLQLRRIRWHFKNNQRNLWSEVRWLRKFYPFNRTAVRRAHGSSAEHAMRDLIATHAPLRTRRHKARQNGPKHYPQGIQGDRNPLGTPFSSIFRRAAKDGVPEGCWKSRAVGKNVQRKMESPKGVGKVERLVKTYSERWSPRRVLEK